jgi:protease PrsW
MILLAVVAGITPMVIYPLFLCWIDRFEKEPLGLIVATFLWGFIPAAIFSIIFQVLLGLPLAAVGFDAPTSDLVSTVIYAPVTEEIFKGMAVLAIFLLWKNEFDGVLDGVIYGGLVGFGFAAIENVLYFLTSDSGGLVSLFFLRSFVFGLNHALFTSLTGIGFGVARHTKNPILRFIAPLAGLMFAMLAHGLHNFTVSFASKEPALLCFTFLSDWGGILFVFGVMLFALYRERQWLVTQLRDEVASNTLSQGQYEIAFSATRRWFALLSVLFSGGPSKWWRVGRYFDTLTELAYKKHAFSQRGEGGAAQSLIVELRTRAASMSVDLSDLTA